MTEKPHPTDPGAPGSGSGGSAPDDQRQGRAGEGVVIRNKRKIDPTGGKGGTKSESAPEAPGKVPDGTGAPADSGQPSPAADMGAAEEDRDAAAGDKPEPAADGGAPTDAEADGKPSPVTALTTPGTEAPAVDEPAEPVETEPSPLAAELEAVRAELDERTKDLQRVTAEYANYRKRVERDRAAVAEQATAALITTLLPILDDLDRAREHGDLVGPFGAVAEQLVGALTKSGLTAFGEKGDPFDPNRHEAVAHLTSAEVTEPTCVEVMRRGYLLGDRLLRAALVAVADPE